MQSVSSRIWTHVAVSISSDCNHYTTGTSFIIVLRPVSFSLQHQQGSLSSPSENKFLQVSRIFFSEFWPILSMVHSGWSQFILWFPILPIPFPSLWVPFQVHHLQLVSLSPSASLVLWQGLRTYLSFCLLSFSLWSSGTAKSITQLVL